MPNELAVRLVMISLEGRVLDRPVHPLDLPIESFAEQGEFERAGLLAWPIGFLRLGVAGAGGFPVALSLFGRPRSEAGATRAIG